MNANFVAYISIMAVLAAVGAITLAVFIVRTKAEFPPRLRTSSIGELHAVGPMAMAGTVVLLVGTFAVPALVPVFLTSPISNVRLTLFEGLLDLPPDIFTRLPSERAVYVALEAPRRAQIYSTKKVELTVEERSLTWPGDPPNDWADMSGPSYVEIRSTTPCRGADRDPLRSCALIQPSLPTTRTYGWLVEATETADAILEIDLGNVGLSSILFRETFGRSATKTEGGQATPEWAVQLTYNGLHASLESETARLDSKLNLSNLTFDFGSGRLLLPITFTTDIGLTRRQAAFAKVVVSFVTLSGGSLLGIFLAAVWRRARRNRAPK